MGVKRTLLIYVQIYGSISLPCVIDLIVSDTSSIPGRRTFECAQPGDISCSQEQNGAGLSPASESVEGNTPAAISQEIWREFSGIQEMNIGNKTRNPYSLASSHEMTGAWTMESGSKIAASTGEFVDTE
jgi:hypothetical protein